MVPHTEWRVDLKISPICVTCCQRGGGVRDGGFRWFACVRKRGAVCVLRVGRGVLPRGREVNSSIEGIKTERFGQPGAVHSAS